MIVFVANDSLATSRLQRSIDIFCTVIPKCAPRPQGPNEAGRRGSTDVVPKSNQCEFASHMFIGKVFTILGAVKWLVVSHHSMYIYISNAFPTFTAVFNSSCIQMHDILSQNTIICSNLSIKLLHNPIIILHCSEVGDMFQGYCIYCTLTTTKASSIVGKPLISLQTADSVTLGKINTHAA